eukprot:bmy_06872T0
MGRWAAVQTGGPRGRARRGRAPSSHFASHCALKGNRNIVGVPILVKQGPGAAPHQAGPRSAGVILEELGVFAWAPHLRSSDLCGSAEAFRPRRRLHLPVPEGCREASSQLRCGRERTAPSAGPAERSQPGATDSLYKLSLQTLNADVFLKQRQTSPPPSSPSPPTAPCPFSSRGSYSSIVNGSPGR